MAASTSSAEKNHGVYAAAKVVDHYRTQSDLFPAERTLLAALGPDLARMAVLDIGIGAGRTTAHLLGKAAEYHGIDYAAPMIEACRRRFPDAPPAALQVGDARSLAFPDNRFDLALFSYNGIDYVGHEDRLRILAEIARVGKPGSVFAFSTHNLMSLGRARADRSVKGLLVRALMRVLNGDPDALKRREYAVIRDDGCGFRLRTYYAHPEAQVRRLSEAGFRDVRIFAADGTGISASDIADAFDPFLHYVSRNGKP